MTLKHIILTCIVSVLVAAGMFVAGMHHAITHMQIEPDSQGTTAYVILHDNVYVHDLSNYRAETP